MHLNSQSIGIEIDNSGHHILFENYNKNQIGSLINLLNYLFSFMNKPEFQIRFKWSKDTIAMWDNRFTMHYAIGDYMPNKRKMHRVTVLHDKREKK